MKITNERELSTNVYPKNYKGQKEIDTKLRDVEAFLWLPKRIAGDWKWVVTAKWEEKSKLHYNINWFSPILGGRLANWSKYNPTKWL